MSQGMSLRAARAWALSHEVEETRKHTKVTTHPGRTHTLLADAYMQALAHADSAVAKSFSFSKYPMPLPGKNSYM